MCPSVASCGDQFAKPLFQSVIEQWIITISTASSQITISCIATVPGSSSMEAFPELPLLLQAFEFPMTAFSH